MDHFKGVIFPLLYLVIQVVSLTHARPRILYDTHLLPLPTFCPVPVFNNKPHPLFLLVLTLFRVHIVVLLSCSGS